MQALRMTGWKQDAQLCEVGVPEPGPGEVLVRIGGSGACHSDLHLMHDLDEIPLRLPFTLGHENAGWVEALGAGVSGIGVGEPVAVYGPWGCGYCRSCHLGFENYCERQVGGAGLGHDGGMAPYMIVPNPAHLVPLGELHPIQAAPLTDAGLTPYSAIKHALPHLVPGSTTVLIGCGGLGHLAVQLLTLLCPTRIIAVDPRPQALTLAADLGAHHTVTAGPDAATEIRDLTAGHGADLVLDLVTTDTSLALGASVLAQRGHLTIVGADHGTLPVGFWNMPFGVSVATHSWGALPELIELIALANTHPLHVTIEQFPLTQAMTAYHHIANGTLTGRAVIVPTT